MSDETKEKLIELLDDYYGEGHERDKNEIMLFIEANGTELLNILSDDLREYSVEGAYHEN